VTGEMQMAAGDVYSSQQTGQGNGDAGCVQQKPNGVAPAFSCYLTSGDGSVVYFNVSGGGGVVLPISAANYRATTGGLPASATAKPPCDLAHRLANAC
jgi:hypothetical protein